MTCVTFRGRMQDVVSLIFPEARMSVSHDEILKSALTLPEADRILLATELLDSVNEPMPGMSIDDPKLLDELKHRRDSMNSSISTQELFSRFDAIRLK